MHGLIHKKINRLGRTLLEMDVLLHSCKPCILPCCLNNFSINIISLNIHGNIPITETLAAALVMLTPWHHDRVLVDPFCGSGTEGLNSLLFTEFAFATQNRASTGRIVSQGIAFVPWNSSGSQRLYAELSA